MLRDFEQFIDNKAFMAYFGDFQPSVSQLRFPRVAKKRSKPASIQAIFGFAGVCVSARMVFRTAMERAFSPIKSRFRISKLVTTL